MQDSTPSIAVFVDYENVALGAREAGYGDFDTELVLERLLDKGSVLVKKAYSDWSRFKGARKPMHEAAFELVEVPDTRYSGKNSADIRLVVDALDLCHTKAHIDLFAIVSGDSDFSPLVNKLRENGKSVVGIGVKQSSSALLVQNCDEFIYYDDLVRARNRERARRRKPRHPEATSSPTKSKEERREEAMELLMDAVEALFRERDEFYGSHVKQVMRRKHPHFSESYAGYKSFNQLLEDAQRRKLLEIKKDERSGGYMIVNYGSEVEVE
jgi:uncharacterized protein (TIGR00288 family)